MRCHTDQRARNLEVLDREERKLDEAALRYERAKATVDFLLLDEDAPEWLLDAAERIEDDRYDELQAQTYFTEQCRGWVHKDRLAVSRDGAVGKLDLASDLCAHTALLLHPSVGGQGGFGRGGAVEPDGELDRSEEALPP